MSELPRIMDSDTFFQNDVPSRLPSDAAAPDFDSLATHAGSLDTVSYPLVPLMDSIARENRALGSSSPSLDALDNPDNPPLFVVAGQQAGLFGGPLYTLYKAMHAIRLASRLTDVLKRPVLPLFWVASDDHDMDEVSLLGLRSDDGAKKTVTYVPSLYREGMPIGDALLDEGIHDAITVLAESLPPGGASAQYLDMIRPCWQPGVRWTEAFSHQLVQMLAPNGLVLFDPRWEGMKHLMAPIMQAELANPLVTTAYVNQAADRFDTARERKHALRRPADSTNLFFETDGIRTQLQYDHGTFQAGNLTLSPSELSDILDAEPERFSPGAALRPVCQDAIMPVCATIAGPGERRYLGQLSEIYHFFGITSSVVWPRASLSIIDRRTARYAKKEGLELNRLFASWDEIEAGMARDTLPISVDTALQDVADTLHDRFQKLEEAVGSVDKSLTGSVQKEQGRITHIIDGIRERTIRAHKASMAMSQRRVAAASYALLPEGTPQERWFGTDSILPVLDEFGIEAFISLTSPEEERHRIVIPE